MNFSEIEGTEEVSMVQVDQMNSNKSPKWDRIHQSIQKEPKDGTVELLTAVCNLSLKTSFIPEEWRQGNMTPNFRRDSWEGQGNLQAYKMRAEQDKAVEAIIKNRCEK